MIISRHVLQAIFAILGNVLECIIMSFLVNKNKLAITHTIAIKLKNVKMYIAIFKKQKTN